MTLRAGLNQVRFRVRSAVLTQERFTAAEIVAMTGLKPESVRTELQRLKSQGYVTSRPLPEKTRTRGRQPVQYVLSSDSDKRAELAHSIQLFDPPASLVGQPTSVHYERAVEALNCAFDASADSKRKKECERLLSEAEEHLKDARLAEGGERASPAIKASLDLLLARILELRGDPPIKIEQLVAGKPLVMVQSFKEWRTGLSIWTQVAAPPSHRITGGTQHALSALEQNVRTDSPLYPVVAALLRIM